MRSRNVELPVEQPAFAELLVSAKQGTHSVMWIASASEVLGAVTLSDSIKPTSSVAVQSLKSLGIKVLLITGDNANVANNVAQLASIDEVFAEVSPAGKSQKIAELRSSGHVVGMVGDGINDAPALAQADVGIAIGTGTDVAMETADVTLMNGDLQTLATAIHLSRATLRNIRQNLFWGLCLQRGIHSHRCWCTGTLCGRARLPARTAPNHGGVRNGRVRPRDCPECSSPAHHEALERHGLKRACGRLAALVLALRFGVFFHEATHVDHASRGDSQRLTNC